MPSDSIDPMERADSFRRGRWISATKHRRDARLRRNIVLVSEGDSKMADFTPKATVTRSPVFGVTSDLNARHATKALVRRALPFRFSRNFPDYGTKYLMKCKRTSHYDKILLQTEFEIVSYFVISIHITKRI